MDVISLIMSVENLRTLVLLVAMFAGFVWFDRRIDQRTGESEKRQDLKMDERLAAFERSLREEIGALRKDMDALAASLRQEMNGLGATLRKEMDERFTVFHKALKENDFAHLHEAMKAMTFTMHKNGFLDPEDKKFIDSHLDDK